MKQQTTKAAFQTWQNGGLQMSGLYLNQDAIDFVESHYNSNTFATLHTFDSIEEAKKVYNRLQEKVK